MSRLLGFITLLLLTTHATSARAQGVATLEGDAAHGPTIVGTETRALTVNPPGGATRGFTPAETALAVLGAPSEGRPAGLTLVSGEVLAGEVVLLNDRLVRVNVRGAGRQEFEPGEVAVVSFKPVEQWPEDFTGPGVVLANGDVIAGEVVDLNRGRVSVDTDLFGVRLFQVNRDVSAVLLRGSAEPAGAWVVRAGEPGEVLVASEVRVRDGTLVVRDVAGGQVAERRFERDTVRSVRRGSVDEQTLTATDVEAPAPTSVRLGEAQGLRLPTGRSLTFAVAPGRTLFTAQVALAPEALPTRRVRVVVLVDGRERFVSEPVRAGGTPVPISADVAGAGRVTVRLDAADGAPAHPSGLLLRPVLSSPDATE